jgi:hypothetical protein
VPRGGLKISHHRLIVSWSARGARGVTLSAAIQYEASAKQGWQTLVAGLTGHSYSIAARSFGRLKHVRIRIVLGDGFSTAVATSQLIRLPRR